MKNKNKTFEAHDEKSISKIQPQGKDTTGVFHGVFFLLKFLCLYYCDISPEAYGLTTV